MVHLSKCFRHVEVEQRLIVDRIFTQIEAYVHAGLHFDAQS